VSPQTLLDQNPDAVILAGTDGVIQYWNEAAERVFGFSPAEALGKELNIIIPEQFRERHWAAYNRALAAGETKYRGQSLPTKARKADGSELYVELGFEIVKDGAGSVIGAMATARDITERFQRERDLRRELRELKAQVDAAS
jgi:PAS domain S-box-containing protein